MSLFLFFSNNNVQDDGAGHIVDGLIEQPTSGSGLSILVLWNNRLTRNSSPHFARALVCSSKMLLIFLKHIIYFVPITDISVIIYFSLIAALWKCLTLDIMF